MNNLVDDFFVGQNAKIELIYFLKDLEGKQHCIDIKNIKDSTIKAITTLNETLKDILLKLSQSTNEPVSKEQILSTLKEVSSIDNWKFYEFKKYDSQDYYPKSEMFSEFKNENNMISFGLTSKQAYYLHYPTHFMFITYPDFILILCTESAPMRIKTTKNKDLAITLKQMLSQKV